MTARLSPAQRRVVDQMRDGAELRLIVPILGYRPWWEFFIERGCETAPRRTVDALVRKGVIVRDSGHPRHVYHLAPAYQGGEA